MAMSQSSYDCLQNHHFDTASCDNTSTVEVYSYRLVQLIMVEDITVAAGSFNPIRNNIAFAAATVPAMLLLLRSTDWFLHVRLMC